MIKGSNLDRTRNLRDNLIETKPIKEFIHMNMYPLCRSSLVKGELSLDLVHGCTNTGVREKGHWQALKVER